MPETPAGWRLAAPAKLNLWLQVVGRRPDGFHELDSLFVLLDLADQVRVDPGGGGLAVRGRHTADVPTDQTNLAWRGWVAGWETGTPTGGLVVDKAIPVAAGLGGGSSDAAAAWHLARHLGEGADRLVDESSEAALVALAAIGADVPFFAARHAAARVAGIGDRVTSAQVPLDAPEVVLVHPPFGLSTAAVFGALTPADWSGAAADPVPGRNDLLAPARRIRPELDDVLRVVARTGGVPHLTGSGPTIFVLDDDPERATDLARRIANAGLGATRTRLRAEPASIEPG